MKTIIRFFICFMLFAVVGCSKDENKQSSAYCNGTEDTDENMVYICNGPHSRRYHCDECCDGLSKCSSEVECISLNEAEGMGRTPCSRCYN